jgi:UDP-glucuronate 4-epimerase
MKILVTGTAGFIGFHSAKRFSERGDEVIGIDNLNDYYDVALKRARLSQLERYPNYRFILMDIADQTAMEKVFQDYRFDRVVHMAAQAGVRYSISNPHTYVQSNVVGFVNLLECCRHSNVPHLVYASSSSVYGLNTKMPFSVHHNVDHPISLYAATKKSNELMAHTYSHLYRLPTTGLRFFTVYGPWGRPDMALFKFTKAMMSGEAIDVFNEGRMKRDFTYIDDIVEGVVRVTDNLPEPNPSWDAMNADPGSSPAPYRIYNIGNNNPVELMEFIRAIETAIGQKAKMNMLPMQPGDVPATYANVEDLMNDVDFSPETPVEEGIQRFIEWYKQYYGKS